MFWICRLGGAMIGLKIGDLAAETPWGVSWSWLLRAGGFLIGLMLGESVNYLALLASGPGLRSTRKLRERVSKGFGIEMLSDFRELERRKKLTRDEVAVFAIGLRSTQEQERAYVRSVLLSLLPGVTTDDWAWDADGPETDELVSFLAGHGIVIGPGDAAMPTRST